MVPFSTEIVICILDVSLDFNIVRSSNERLTFRSGCGSHITQENKCFSHSKKVTNPNISNNQNKIHCCQFTLVCAIPKCLTARLMGNSSLIFF